MLYLMFDLLKFNLKDELHETRKKKTNQKGIMIFLIDL